MCGVFQHIGTRRGGAEGAAGIYPEGNSNPDLVLENVTAKHSNHMQKQKALYPNAYKPWSEADDALLTKLYKKGTSMKELMSLFQRNRGGIAARLRKLGLT